MIPLLIKASLVIMVLWAFYKLFLEKESFFALNRIYLLACLLFAFILPFVVLPELVKNQGIVNTILIETAYEGNGVVRNGMQIAPTDDRMDGSTSSEEMISTAKKINTQTKGMVFWMTLIYFFGVVILSLNLMAQLIGLFSKVLKNTDRVEDGRSTILDVDMGNGPCSFFSYIFINPNNYDHGTYEQILEHEKIHVKKRHSIDLLLSEVAIIVLWFNPFIWMFRKEVEKNIEYQTDALLLDTTTVEPQEYQMNLLKIAVQRKPLTLVSNYNQSLIKKRILMMNSKKSNNYSYWKYAFLAPVLLVALLLLNRPYVLNAQESTVFDFYEEEGDGDENEFHGGHSDDLPPLLEASSNGNIQAVKTLIDQGADVNMIVSGDGTALFMAIRHTHFKIAQLLLEHGADPNLGSRSDGYPLLIAVASGDLELVRLLVEKGAEVDKDFLGDGNAIIIASKRGNLEMVKVLIALGADINRGVKGDGNPLIMAAKRGHIHVVKHLVEVGADVNYEITGDETPLIGACEQGHITVVKYLIDKGADVNKSSTDPRSVNKPKVRTPLNMARLNGHDEVVKYLIKKGAVERQ